MAPRVKHVSECFIRPKYEVEDAKKPVYLSPMELLSLSSYYNQKGLLFRKKQQDSMADLLASLKHSLSVALIHFYPLAGQLETQVDEDEHTRLVFINCNKGPGARFIHATVHMTISDILSAQYVPDVVQSFFFDHQGVPNYEGHTRSLLSVQVTELVEGVYIGCSMNHMCVDGTSTWHFFNMWSQIFKADGESIQISRPPIHERWFLDGTGPIIKLPFTHPDEFTSRSEAAHKLPKARFFHFSAECIAKLKAKANSECGTTDRISSFQALAALVWRSITRARGLEHDTETRCKFSINYRGRLNPPLSQNHFAKMIQLLEGSSKAGKLLSQNLGWGALLLNQAVEDHTDQKVRKMADKCTRSPSFIKTGSLFGPHCIVIGSSPRFDIYGTEFGMGKALAVLSGSAFKFDGLVNFYPDREGGGNIDLEICLGLESMKALESDEEFMELVSGACRIWPLRNEIS